MGSDRTSPPSFAEALGAAIRAVRLDAGVTASEIAGAAGFLGLPWHRSTVAAIESGRRGLSAEELLVLPWVLSSALPREVTLHELVDSISEHVLITPRALASRDGIRQALRGAQITMPEWRTPQIAAEVIEGIKKAISELPGLLPADVPESLILDASRDTRREAEQKAARRLGRPVIQVAVAARRLWGHGLTEEREHRLEPSVSEEETRGSVRAHRGHVTRQLLRELAAELEAFPVPPTKPHTPQRRSLPSKRE